MLAYARDANGVPVGNFSDAGGIFVNFPGCGLNAEGQFNGVVHSNIVTCNVSLLEYPRLEICLIEIRKLTRSCHTMHRNAAPGPSRCKASRSRITALGSGTIHFLLLEAWLLVRLGALLFSLQSLRLLRMFKSYDDWNTDIVMMRGYIEPVYR